MSGCASASGDAQTRDSAGGPLPDLRQALVPPQPTRPKPPATGGHAGFAPKQPEAPVSAWLYYATVDNADHAGNRARELGAKIFVGPMDVPGGGRMLAGIDPQGASFAVYAHATEG